MWVDSVFLYEVDGQVSRRDGRIEAAPELTLALPVLVPGVFSWGASRSPELRRYELISLEEPVAFYRRIWDENAFEETITPSDRKFLAGLHIKI